MDDLMKDKPRLFEEGTVILNGEAILLKKICVYPAKSNEKRA